MTSIDTDESIRETIKREEWLVNGDIYGINTGRQVLAQVPMYKENGGMNHSDYYQYPQYVEQDYSAYSLIGQEQNVDTGEIWDKRKETTSFEHEQPLSSSILPRYVGYMNGNSNDLVCSQMPDVEWIETLVVLVRQDNGFGFRIVGGTEEGAQVNTNLFFKYETPEVQFIYNFLAFTGVSRSHRARRSCSS